MTLSECIDYLRVSSKTVLHDGELIHETFNVLEEGERYVITSVYLKEKLSYYAIFYQLGERVCYTISTVFAMKQSCSILTTRLLEPTIVEEGRVFMVEHDIRLEELEEKEEILGHIRHFVSFLAHLPMVRMKLVVGEYEWYIHDAMGRRVFE